ncbi:helix-turn-helix domain-containing protein [Polaromonas sp. YR568]|uniref:helix-turn-helix domain-containing protein n=1 Tax=Polaromonas sp. YR568 TaxID=1855301 RepID=UPI003137702F
MANIASLLKSEISRIARKEIRAETETLKKASAQYRSDIAALKRRLAEQDRLIAKLRKNKPAAAANDKAEETSQLRFRADGFASLRKKLGLSAADMGKLLGVSLQTIYHWEKGQSKPRASQLQGIAEVRKLGKRGAAARLAADHILKT